MYTIGLDIGGTKIYGIISDLSGKIVYERKVNTYSEIDDLIEWICTFIDKSPVSLHEITGMGVGVPSIVDRENGLVLDAYSLTWTNVPLKEILATTFEFPIWVDNDVNFAALGESTALDKKSNNILFIAIGTGLGCGIIINGHLVTGAKGFAGEVGFNISSLSDSRNTNGFGALEDQLSGTALSKYGDPYHLFQHYWNRKEPGFTVINQFINLLTVQIVNMVNLLNPEYVIIGGGVSESMEPFIKNITKNVNDKAASQTKIKLAQLKNKAGAIGAAYIARRQLD
ncbi:glucokinase [Gracilibacillus orientalis]|uniref:Glucokinase n=1 Tax=Gracilibacillus orientalis TaxID=334253 RepID=A0A1I4GVE0_9BACI|nr:ROK family protein [Gracilibacillus orientalis]SFL33423.1 glucokinase [Gracilibacillus orientalis]